jgi:hypothetical protein
MQPNSSSSEVLLEKNWASKIRKRVFLVHHRTLGQHWIQTMRRKMTKNRKSPRKKKKKN